MYIMIVGCSQTGYHLSKALITMGHEVVVVEKNSVRCRLMWEEMGSVAVHGDGANPDDLKRAGINRAQALIAVTGRDETNLVVCQIAKHSFGVERTVATIKDAQNQSVFRLLGVDAVISISDLILTNLEGSVESPNIKHLLRLRAPNAIMVSVTILEDAAVVGKPLAQIDLPPHTFVALITRQERALPPNDSLTLTVHDELHIVTSADEEPVLYDILGLNNG